MNGGNGASLGRGNALLELTHFLSKGGLITYRRGHPAQQRRNLGTCECIAIDIVNKEQYIAAFVTEFFCHGQTTEGDPQTVTRRLVHLAKDHGYLGLPQIIKVNHTGLGHLVIEVISFASTLTHTGKYRQTAVLLGDVVDQLKHVDGLAHPGAPEQADLAPFGKGTDQVNDLDPGFEQLNRWRELVRSEERRGGTACDRPGSW